MAFQALANGADCGPSNAFQNLIKHIDREPQSARLDNLTHPGPSQQQSHPHGQLINPPRQNEQEARQFLDPGRQNPYEMSKLMNTLNSTRQEVGRSVPNLGQGWGQQFSSSNLDRSSGSLGPEELAHMEKLFSSQPSHLMMNSTHREEAQWANEFFQSKLSNPTSSQQQQQQQGHSFIPYDRTPSFGMGHDRFRSSHFATGLGLGYGPESSLGSATRMFDPSGQINQNHNAKLVELSDENWEAEFAKIGEVSNKSNPISDLHLSSNTEADLTPSTRLETSELTEPDEEVDDTEADAAFMKSLEETWKNLASNLHSTSLTDQELSGWEREFGNLDQTFTSDLRSENVGDFLKDPIPYPFSTDNVFVDHPDPLEEGRRLIRTGAPLGQAALAFEAACQLDPTRGEAWRILGETHAADEKEHLAIKAFEKAIGCGGPDAQASWMSLAIAWVNEGHEMRALATLERWLEDTYPDVAASVLSAQHRPSHNPWDRHSRVVEMYLAAARAGPNVREGPGKEMVRNQVVDADVQVGLGVLFYSNSEYERARDCFEAALGVNPGDFLLWNRLGATLANGGQPEQAIDAYRRALELRPTYTRAIYNLGVSCLNINCYKEAAEHLLAALSLHRKSDGINGTDPNVKHPLLPDGDGSDNLWHTLRRAFLCLDRPDLADRALPGVDVDSFRIDGFEF